MNTLILDNSYQIRNALKIYLGCNSQITVVGERLDGIDVIPFLNNNNVDAIIMDVKMPKMNGLEATYLVREYYPNIKVVIFSMYEYQYNGISYKDIIRENMGKVNFVSKWEANPNKIINSILH